jgi:DNA-binding CsgD family transcriptional regulator
MRLQALAVTGDTLELSRGENSPPLLAHASNRTAEIFDIEGPAVAIFVVDPLAELGAQIHRFASKFGLTPGEPRILKEFNGGNGLPAAAARLKVTPATARTHTYRIFEKTGTSRQAELIRRFFESSVPAHTVAVELP